MMASMNQKIILEYPGIPCSYKNNKHIIQFIKDGRPRTMVALKKRAKMALDDATLVIQSQWGYKPLQAPLQATFYFYGPWVFGKCSIDLDNLLGMPADILEHAGVIKNDKQIQSFGNSHMVYMCQCCPDLEWMPRKKVFRDTCGHKDRCPYAKTRIELTVLRRPKESMKNYFARQVELPF